MSTRISRRLLAGTVLAVLLLATGILSFAGSRLWSTGEAARATDLSTAPEARAVLSGAESRGVEISTPPDTTQPGWYEPYVEAELAEPRYDQVVAGILVGPTVENATVERCTRTNATLADPTLAAGSPVAISPAWLPDNAALERQQTIACDGEIVANEAEYYVVAGDDAERQRSEGAAWDEVEHGGVIVIYRFETAAPAWKSTIAASRWSEGTIADNPAALGAPVIANGWGQSFVITWNDGVQTVVTARARTMEEIMRIAEEVLR